MYIRWWTLVKVWIAYALPFLPFLPEIGDATKADCILAQAFGRNSINDNELAAKIRSVRLQARMRDDQTLELLQRQGFDPGAANKAVAKYCIQLVNQLRIPLLAQWEVVYAIWVINPGWYKQHQSLIDHLWPEVKEKFNASEGAFTTYDVVEVAKLFMSQRDCSRPLNVAHPAMAVRAIMIMWKLGIKPVAQRIPLWKFWKHSLWVWEKGSTQKWTRRFFPHWLVRETPGRGWLVLKKKVSFMPPPYTEEARRVRVN